MLVLIVPWIVTYRVGPIPAQGSLFGLQLEHNAPAEPGLVKIDTDNGAVVPVGEPHKVGLCYYRMESIVLLLNCDANLLISPVVRIAALPSTHLYHHRVANQWDRRSGRDRPEASKSVITYKYKLFS